MEQKTMKSSNFMKLLINSLIFKKNWFFISTVIIFVTTFLIPYILNSTDKFFIVFGIVEIFIIVFLNCLIDNSFLHSDSKLAYYKSKPVSFEKRISINIVSNIIFTCFLMILLYVSITFHNVTQMFADGFKLFIPWLIIGIFITALSSVLTGNTIVAGIITIFNFSLPALIYIVIMFVFTILEDIVIGFSANVLMDTLTNTFYKLEYIYFYEYVEKSIDYIYILLFGSILIGLAVAINICLKKRKNENTGDFIVSDGYKYFVSVIASLIVPATLAMLLYEVGIVSKIIVFVILSILSYYIIIAILEKSFSISIYSVKLFIWCMSVFVIFTSGTIVFANQFKNYVPNPKDVNMVYVGDNAWVFNNYLNGRNSSEIKDSEDFMKWARKQGMNVFTEEENIMYVTDLHNEILKDQKYYLENYYYSNNTIISYWMKDGKVIIRDYNLKSNEDDTQEVNKKKNDIAKNIIKSKELKEKQYYYLYDENYYKNKKIYINVKNSNYNIVADNLNLDNLRENLVKDIDKMLLETENSFEYLIYNRNNYARHKEKENNDGNYYIEIYEKNTNSDDNVLDEIYINDDFKNTLKILQIKD